MATTKRKAKPTPARNLAAVRAEFEHWADNNYAAMLNPDLDKDVSAVLRALKRLHNTCVILHRRGDL